VLDECAVRGLLPRSATGQPPVWFVWSGLTAASLGRRPPAEVIGQRAMGSSFHLTDSWEEATFIWSVSVAHPFQNRARPRVLPLFFSSLYYISSEPVDVTAVHHQSASPKRTHQRLAIIAISSQLHRHIVSALVVVSLALLLLSSAVCLLVGLSACVSPPDRAALSFSRFSLPLSPIDLPSDGRLT
jgi:hypothetical protein